MTIMRNGQSGEIIEALTYAPGLAGGTDLEGATKTISATSEQAGADYTSIHTIAAPTGSRIAVLRGCMRLTVTIDSFAGGCTTLNARVKRGGASVWTGVLEAAAGAGQKKISWDITTLITGAQTNTLFLWVNVGTCVISEVTMWTAVGTKQAADQYPCLGIGPIVGWLTFNPETKAVGTGNHSVILGNCAEWTSLGDSLIRLAAAAERLQGTIAQFYLAVPYNGMLYFYIHTGTVATDLNYLNRLLIVSVTKT